MVGAGIIGVSLALELRRRGMNVLVLDRGQPGAEASTAGAGMLVAGEMDGPPELRALARLSAQVYPDFVRAAEAESDISVDFNQHGAICLGKPLPGEQLLTDAELIALEPSLSASSLRATFVAEDVVDPRTLMPALVQAGKRRGVHIHGGSEVISLLQENSRVAGVETRQTKYHAPVVVNCCGAWSAELQRSIPTRPVKGHMLALIPARPHPIRHVIRNRETDVYLVPRRDGRIAVGSTVEEAGFDKRVDPDIIQRLHQLAADILPELGEARIHESWTGLRPGTPDKLPILGAVSGDRTPRGYFVATGHFRNGILLAPATAIVMAELITGATSSATQSATQRIDLTPFAPTRF